MVYHTEDFMNLHGLFIVDQNEKAQPHFSPEATNRANIQNIFCLEYSTIGKSRNQVILIMDSKPTLCLLFYFGNIIITWCIINIL